MKVLVYDVETTGIPEKYAKINQTNRWPYIVQFSWLLFDTSKNSLISVDDHIIQLPKNLKMAPGSIKIHGITNKQMRAEGKDIITILNKFQNSVNSANILVAHNLDFDTNMISVEQLRNIVPKNKRFRLLVNNRTKKYCTMKRGKTIANIKMCIAHCLTLFLITCIIHLLIFLFVLDVLLNFIGILIFWKKMRN
jgi:DNA polymerase III epsilon subunit-like protein